MIEFTWIKDIAPILVAVIVFIIVYASLTKLKVPGSNTVLAILSAMVALVLVASKRNTEYIATIIPWFTVITIIMFFIVLALALVAKDLDTFKKPLAWLGFIAAIFIVFCAAADVFPTFYHLLPNTSDTYLNSSLRGFKDWVYSNRIVNSLILIASIAIVGFFAIKN